MVSNNIILYTIGCPKCKVLEIKMNQKNIKFEIINDIDIMKEKGIQQAPVLEVDGKLYNFTQAIKWVNECAN